MAKKLDRSQVISALREVVREVVAANGGNAGDLARDSNPLVGITDYFDSISSEEATVMVGAKLGVAIQRNPFFGENQQPVATFEDVVRALCDIEYEEINA